MSKIIHLQNLGPVSRLAIPLYGGGGVILFRGHNGCGKTISLEAISSLLTGQGRAPVSDGATQGQIRGLGATITFGRRTTRAGEIEVRHIQGVDPSVLVDPGIKDPLAADAARIKALCILAGVDNDWHQFDSILPDDCPPVDELLEGAALTEDLPSIAARLKRVLEARARATEKEADGRHREALGIRSSAGDIPEIAEIDEASLANATEEAVRALALIEGRATAEREAQTRAAAARQAMSQMEVPDVAEAEGAETKARQRRERAQKIAAAAAEEAAVAKATLTAEIEAEEVARRRAADSRRASVRMAELQRAIDASGAIIPIPHEDFIAARTAVTEARQAQDAGAVARHAVQQMQRAVALSEQAARLKVQSEALRQAAQATESVLSAAIVSLAPRGLRVENSRLVIDHEARGRTIPYADLSDGERWPIALEIGADSVGPTGALVLPQPAWEGLDPTARARIHAHARSLRLALFSAQADDGPIRVEMYSPPEPAGGKGDDW